jgi:hypothetical protein
MEKTIQLAIEKLQQADINGFINEKSKIDFHHGFLAGARAMNRMMLDGNSLEQALDICERHHFTSIVMETAHD